MWSSQASQQQWPLRAGGHWSLQGPVAAQENVGHTENNDKCLLSKETWRDCIVCLLDLSEVAKVSSTQEHLKHLFIFFMSSNLSNNKISEIEDGAFEGASSVVELHLTANHLESVRGSMFKGMEGLRMLWVGITSHAVPNYKLMKYKEHCK